MTELSTIDWPLTCNRLVGFFDIAGFKKKVSRDSSGEVLNALTHLYNAVHTATDHDRTRNSVYPVFFSDSVLLVSKDDLRSSTDSMFLCSEWLLGTALLDKLPMTGAIAYGEQTVCGDKSIYFGRPLIDAFELQDSLGYYGVVLHPTVVDFLRSKRLLREMVDSEELRLWDTPFKSSRVKHYNVDWTSVVHDFDGDPISVVSDICHDTTGPAKQFIDNTIEFLNAIKSH